MINQLPNNVKVGDHVFIQPDALNCGPEETAPTDLVGVVSSIPDHRRFAVVQYERRGVPLFRESVPIVPPKDRIPHKEPKAAEPGGHPKPPAQSGDDDWHVPITKQLQSGDWSGMTSTQIAEKLRVSTVRVTSAIYALGKKGINIHYKKRKPGCPQGVRKKTAGTDRQREEQRRAQRAIGEYRKTLGMTQRELAEKLDMSKSGVCHWEHGEYAADWRRLETALPGVTEYARKTAAGETNSDDGKEN
ncbi:MAG: helix-turn-helix domain-containing protein [Clostridiales bacterium]|nr:helix-turn-helix domain-containing protein [Clostridiales bacterium]